MSATARPWHRKGGALYDGADKMIAGFYLSSTDDAEANAGLAVKAVNLHDELVAEMHRLADRLAANIDVPLEQCVGGEFAPYRVLLAKLEEHT